MSLLRDLHPELDVLRYEVCWPVLLPAEPVDRRLPDYSRLREDWYRVRGKANQADVRAVLTDEFQSVKAIAQQVRLTEKPVYGMLEALERDGTAERVMQVVSSRGRSQRVYRIAGRTSVAR